MQEPRHCILAFTQFFQGWGTPSHESFAHLGKKLVSNDHLLLPRKLMQFSLPTLPLPVCDGMWPILLQSHYFQAWSITGTFRNPYPFFHTNFNFDLKEGCSFLTSD